MPSILSVLTLGVAALFGSNILGGDSTFLVSAQELVDEDVCIEQDVEFWFNLSATNQIGRWKPSLEEDVWGQVRLNIRPSMNPQKPPKLCINARFSGNYTPGALHLHQGAMNKNGRLLRNLTNLIVPKGNEAPTIQGCRNIDKLTASRLLNNPSKFYMEAHDGRRRTPEYIYGLRGQVLQSIEATALCPSKEVAPFQGYYGAAGEGTVTFKDAGKTACVYVGVDGFDARSLMGHLHEGVEGTNGRRLISFDGTLVIGLCDGCRDFFRGCVPVEDDTLAVKVLENPSNYYYNIHAGIDPDDKEDPSYYFGVRSQVTASPGDFDFHIK